MQQQQGIRLIRMKDLTAKLGISRSKIYEMLNPNSPRYDPTFPKPINIGKHAVGWIEQRIDEWILQKEGGRL